LHPRNDFRLASWPLDSCRGWTAHTFPDIEEPIRRWAEYARRFREFTRRRDRIRAELADRAQESAGKVFSLEEQLAQAAGGEEAQRLGELILASLHRFGAGFRGESVTVTDFYEPESPERVIALDPEKSLKENADRFFQQYRKSRAARERLPGLLADARQRAARFEELAGRAGAATREAELDELAARVPAGRRRHTDVAVREKKAVRTYQFRRYETASGVPVLVGRSATENDRLTFRVAGPNDIWFHVRDYRGSHVILQWGKKNDPPPADLRAAAAVAAHFSDAADSPLVDVHWTRRKFVQKVKGTPGLVRLARSHTIRVAPGLPDVSDES
jgi:predicted ribosome quality control (RQC) complex YloA/Tae2 family protein